MFRSRVYNFCFFVTSFIFVTYFIFSVGLYRTESSDNYIETPKPQSNFLSETKKTLEHQNNDKPLTLQKLKEMGSSLFKTKTIPKLVPPPANVTKPKIWVSLGLCFSETTEKYGKKHYPYTEITPLGLMIWNYFFPDPSEVQVILYLIHKEPEKNAHMEAYEKSLLATGANLNWVYADGIDCVLKAQLIRMFAFGHPLVRPKDVVVTVDVNFFLLTDKIFYPIYNNPDRLAWVYQWEDTAFVSTGQGETFNQNLIAMPARIWRSILEAPSTLTKAWLDEKIKQVNLDENDTWYDDQWITTYSLLRHRICNVPKTSGLWNRPGLLFDPDFEDSETCWHGRYYKDCNYDMRIVAEGCKWWHFHPDEKFEAHLDKFNEITNNSFLLNITSIVKR